MKKFRQFQKQEQEYLEKRLKQGVIERFTDTSAALLPPCPFVTSAPSQFGPNHLGPKHLGPSHFGPTVTSAPSHMGPILFILNKPDN